MFSLPVLCLFFYLGIAAGANAKLSLRAQARRLFRGRQRMQLRGGRSALLMSGPSEQLEAWKDHGKACHTKLSDDNLIGLSSLITTEAYSKELHSLVDQYVSRFVAHSGNANAAEYIKKEFKAMGLDVSEQVVEDDRIKEQYNNFASVDPEMEVNKAKSANIMGFLKGSDLANEVVLVGAHYDSVNFDQLSGSAPGVDDNGSGSALMLQLARVLTGAEQKFRPRRSVMFVAFNAEEQGLVGSEHFVKMYRANPEKIGDLKAAFIADEVAWPGRGDQKRQAIFETKGEGDETNAMVDTLAKYALVKNTTSQLAGDGIGDGTHNFVVNYHGFASDHMSFLDQGIPSVLLIEKDDDYHAETWGHSARDTFEHVDLSYGASMARLALRAVAAFAMPADRSDMASISRH